MAGFCVCFFLTQLAELSI